MDSTVTQDWETQELYEKQRVKKRRRLFLTISAAFLVFLGLCSLPVIEERSPKWKSLALARRLAVEIEQMKTLAIHKKKPLSLKIHASGDIQVFELKNCKDERGTLQYQKKWMPLEKFAWLTSNEAISLDLKWVVNEFCFDPVFGMPLSEGAERSLMVIVPVKDLTNQRLDRASYVVLDGSSAKISIN